MDWKWRTCVRFFMLLTYSSFCTCFAFNRTSENKSVQNETYPDPCETPTESYRDIIFVFLLVCVFIIAVVGNSFAVVVIVLSKTLRSHPTNIFIASLAASDLGVTFFTIPITIDGYIYRQNFCFHELVCKMSNFTELVFHISSVSHLFAIAIERFLAIKAPFAHHTIMTKKTTFICVLATWLYSVIWAFLGMVNWETGWFDNVKLFDAEGTRVCANENRIYFTVVYSVTYLIPLCIMGALYAAILKIALKQARAVASLRPQNLDPINIKNNQKVSTKKTQEMRATKTLAIVYGAFFVCWFPVTIITLTSNWCPECYVNFRNENKFAFEMVVALFIEALPPLNSCLNPFVYILFNRQFRKAFKNLILKMLRKPRNIDDDTNFSFSGTFNKIRKQRRERYKPNDETFSQRSGSPMVF